MNSKQLTDIANILRRDSLEMTTAAGSGHPTSCLSCAEIMATLFFDEMQYDQKNPKNISNDEVVLSKGHAAPILYAALKRSGCIKDNLLTLRKLSSNLEGHPVPRSLPWVKVATGSLGQGLGVGVGMALAAKLQRSPSRTFVLLGDSEVAEGSVFEALQLATHYKLNNLVAVIDINRLGQRGETLLGHSISQYKKRFSGFGWNVLTINGHNIDEIKKAFRSSKTAKQPTLILAKTLKGKGVSLMENKDNWHGKAASKEELVQALKELPNSAMPRWQVQKPKSFSAKHKKSKLKMITNFESEATRKVYGQTLSNLTKSDSRIIAIDAEVSNSTFSKLVRDSTPNQFIESFIAEQNMVSMATGLSTKGFKVFASTFAAFFSRAYDQIRMAAISNANLVISGSHAGVSIGEDGASQMALEDLSMMRSLPNSIVFYPSDPVSAQAVTIQATKNAGITYIRTSRPKTPVLYNPKTKFPLGDFKILKQSSKDQAVLIGSGITTHEALKAYEVLRKKGVDVAVVDLYCIKPFKHRKLHSFVKKHGNKIILAEDHHPEGGIGEMVTSKLSGTNIEMKHLAVEQIPHSGKKDELLKKYGIDKGAYLKAFKFF